MGRRSAKADARQELDLSVALLLAAGRVWARAEFGHGQSRDGPKKPFCERKEAGSGWCGAQQGNAGDQRVRAAVSARNLFMPLPLMAAAIRRFCLCCSQQSRAVVKLCVMVLSRTENKLCQPSACPVMMLCLSTAVLRSGCLPCREETCVPFPPPAAPEPSPC